MRGVVERGNQVEADPAYAGQDLDVVARDGAYGQVGVRVAVELADGDPAGARARSGREGDRRVERRRRGAGASQHGDRVAGLVDDRELRVCVAVELVGDDR